MNDPGYYDQHNACPACRSTSFETTTVGYIGPKDHNAVTCNCGWVGIVDDLIQDMGPLPQSAEEASEVQDARNCPGDGGFGRAD